MRIFLFIPGQDSKVGIETDFNIEDIFTKIEAVYPEPIVRVTINVNAIFPDANDKTRAYYYISVITEDGEVVTIGLSNRRFPLGRNIFNKGVL